ncbi:hypothetical protein [Natrarchaeobius chitinivorans]|uniref:Uncharacterized protein n=1 Tax=Natrarchaeobius chitinivorans TaxID=1679083 RepID=A0A3N6LTX7_NATCH|nr:hypothetical protein [Natrarchaeobius chitinivorans]RQG90964.1 hypothetical protein EA473_19460 [Natrarchaeobius chitinivorans]
MTEQVDVQELAIGVGTVIAFALYGYGSVVNETILGVDATDLAILAFAGTFLAVATLHGAYGRRDFALAHAVAGVGLALVAVGSSGVYVLIGFLLLAGGGGYVARETLRVRKDASDATG